MHALVELLARWRNEGLDLAEPVSAAQVQAVFSKLGATATPDVLAMYAAIGGMHEMNRELWCLWPLELIERENVESSPDGVLFSDYMINSWCYRLKNNGDGTSAVWVDPPDGSPSVPAARTLAEFFELYKTDATQLLDPAANQ